MQSISIDARFCGPPDSGNGGYCCGLLGRLFDGPVEVTLKAPPPLGQPLRIEQDESDARLLGADGELIARARKAELKMALPDRPGWNAALAAQRRYSGFDEHNFPGCFVCGPQREESDGLRIFAGPLDNDDDALPVVAGPWRPGAELANGEAIDAVYVWAALDCPGYFGLGRPGLAALLGQMTAEVLALPRVNERCICIGFPLGNEGRKFFAGSAVFGDDGRLLGRSRQVWIELPD